ncbi:DUF6343 family protein [Planosporangium mesophilum]|uniref:DUF6343 family protein n=1 Tax=Planosporangium mesophilum TaxID=689768 RepID=UPI001EF1CD9D|nr:DUF6343 family protein [Planosporangium mesophilum]
MNLRLAFAGFGLVTCALLAVGLAVVGARALAVVAAVLAVVALVDVVVIQLRRRHAGRAGPGRRSLFS